MEQKIIKSKFSCQRGGLTIRGTCYRPNGENLPIAIVSHGFMANQLTVKHYAKELAGLGYASFCFDFCGGCVALGKSDGETIKMSVATEVEDLLAVVNHTKGLGYTNSQKILLMGCSQGGFVSALTAKRLEGQVQKLVLFYPAFCIPDDARRGKMMLAKFDPKNLPARFRCGPMKLGRRYVEDVINMDVFEEIKGYFGEVLIVHGNADKIVDLSYSKRALKVYQESGQKALLKVIDGGRHMFSKRHDKIAIGHLVDFARLC